MTEKETIKLWPTVGAVVLDRLLVNCTNILAYQHSKGKVFCWKAVSSNV